MKRIVFCFDGTWNALAGIPTNVVLTAASIKRRAENGIAQIIYYDEGVGTAWYDKYIGGMFGWGLLENVREAYRYLIFNYDPGDEIFVFGFSRGAFSARTFVGLMRHVGPIRRLYSDQIDEAIKLYHERVKSADPSNEELHRFRAKCSGDVCIDANDDEWRSKNIPGYVKGSAPILRVKYLGVWDTVSALGVPQAFPGSAQMNMNFRFHDPSVTDFIENARHAVAIDERRVLFPPVLFGDLTALNEARDFKVDDENAPYQERWFPGVHGSVGGGGDFRGLSDGALAWVLNGAKRAGLELDSASGSRIQSIAPDPMSPVVNAKKPSTNPAYKWKTDRVGPDHLYQLSSSVIRRWKASREKLPENRLYRPKTLTKVAKALDEYKLVAGTEVFELLQDHVVQQGETLSALAYKYYGHADKYKAIFDANRDTLDSPDDLFIGWTLHIPKLPE
ncbi:MAG: DUF2235 domain-containing protein, partial [Candidatus Obscuribacterales bacterium]|nr:DUF2235 domain-containing protein [Candidatus Obscuribacterales bacterium]